MAEEREQIDEQPDAQPGPGARPQPAEPGEGPGPSRAQDQEASTDQALGSQSRSGADAQQAPAGELQGEPAEAEQGAPHSQPAAPEPGASSPEPAATRSCRRKWAAIAALLVVAVALAVAALVWPGGEDDDYRLVTDGTLTVASSLDCPPYATTADDAPSGYDIAVIQGVANRLGLACVIERVPVETAARKAAAGEGYDVGIASLSPSRDGVEGVEFSEAYCLIDQAVVVKARAYNTADDLSGRVIAAPEGSAGLESARALSDSVLACPDVAGCFTLLERGSVAAVVVDAPVAEAQLAQHGTCRIIERIAANDARAIAVSADNPNLKQAINDAIEAMEDDGTLAALQAQYL